ncbi:glycosyltransferase family 2 protein [Clostridium perfringens]|nr:glycosyltransferase family 2 protein [Clostridium perfringens]
MNNDSLITVFTPVYNRAYIIAKCYESLKCQTFKDFEWLIYDDGSTDDIEEVVNNFIKEGLVKIRYYKYKNRGKHVAINMGSELAKGECFL